MQKSWTKFVEATGKAKEMNELVHRQAMFCIENFLTPKRLILGEETAKECYGTTEFKAFRVEGYEIPVEIVEGRFVYLVGEA